MREEEIILKNNKKEIVKFNVNDDDTLTESCLNIIRYFYKKKVSRK